MRLLLDTHTFLWAVREPQKLSGTALDLIATRDNDVIVSAAVAWELAIKYQAGKLPEAAPVITDYAATLVRLGASSLPILHSHTLHAGLLDWHHRDPFDRLLGATAIIEGLPLISKDPMFDSLPDLRRIW